MLKHRAIVTLGLAALGLAACASSPKNPARTATNVDMLFPLKATPQPDQIALAAHADGLSYAQANALRSLAGRLGGPDGGQVKIEAPQGAIESLLSAKAAQGVRDALVADGVPAEEIVVASYESSDPKAPIKVSFVALKTQVAACGKWDDLTHTRDNNVQSNFGCAVSANMAAQIADANDVVHPHEEQAPSAERRITVLGKYTQGAVTSSQSDAAASVAISKAIN